MRRFAKFERLIERVEKRRRRSRRPAENTDRVNVRPGIRDDANMTGAATALTALATFATLAHLPGIPGNGQFDRVDTGY